MKEIFPVRLKETRAKLGLTQKQVSEVANISPASYSAYEQQGGKMPPLDIAFRIANALDVSLDWLCGREHKREMRTYADVARALVEINNSIYVEFQVNKFKDEIDQDAISIALIVYRDSHWINDPDYDGLNSFDYPHSINFRRFLQTWIKTMGLTRTGEIEAQFFAPWLADQYKQLNVELPKFRESTNEDCMSDADIHTPPSEQDT